MADFDDPLDVKVVTLDEACRRQQVGEGHFPDLDAVPAQAMTVTIPALLRAWVVLAIVPEGRKAQAVHDALTEPVSTRCPATILRTRDDVVLYLDLDSSARARLGAESGAAGEPAFEERIGGFAVPLVAAVEHVVLQRRPARRGGRRRGRARRPWRGAARRGRAGRR